MPARALVAAAGAVAIAVAAGACGTAVAGAGAWAAGVLVDEVPQAITKINTVINAPRIRALPMPWVWSAIKVSPLYS